MARLLKGIPIFAEDGRREGVSVLYLVGNDTRTLWLPEADIAGLDLAEIKTLAQQRADADPGRPGQPMDLFNMEREAKEALENLPGWTRWDRDQAVAHVHDAIYNGMTIEELEAWIDANVTGTTVQQILTSIRTALKQLVRADIATRNIQEKLSEMAIFQRDIVIK